MTRKEAKVQFLRGDEIINVNNINIFKVLGNTLKIFTNDRTFFIDIDAKEISIMAPKSAIASLKNFKVRHIYFGDVLEIYIDGKRAELPQYRLTDYLIALLFEHTEREFEIVITVTLDVYDVENDEPFGYVRGIARVKFYNRPSEYLHFEPKTLENVLKFIRDLFGFDGIRLLLAHVRYMLRFPLRPNGTLTINWVNKLLE